ncbi:MAG TPA: hypothetical protein VNF74_14505, partial [Terriglobales bacterium]|nr:hypothetical protein [Terriglobales bacterium]
MLLVPGSLNSDVDGNFAPLFPGQPALAPHAYKDLAEQLAASDLAVLRYATFGQRVRVAAASSTSWRGDCLGCCWPSPGTAR